METRKVPTLTIYLTTFCLFRSICSATGPCALVEPHAESLCIPLEAINRAFRDARLVVGLKYPFAFPSYETHLYHHEIDKLGMVLTETTKFLAKEFQLSHEQIYDLIPKLDLELTDIWEFCPRQFRHKDCKLTRYRSISGHCNNLNHPDWGASHTPFTYILPPQRPDGIDHPKDPDQERLPSARVVSSKIHRDHVTHDHAVTIMLIAWGQIIDHDITFTAESKEPHSHKDPDCCHKDAHGSHSHAHHNCYPIQIPEDDSFYSSHGHNCMSFARSFSGVRSECRLGPRTAFNTISSYLDASFVYGSNKILAKKLRSGKYGMLRSLPVLANYGLKDLLPVKVENPEDGCIQPNPDIFCFLAGDNRVNEQLVLTVLHTIFMREHNRIAHKLSRINPHWDDERLYQETRRIIIAITQHITFEEFLPMVLGKELMHEYGISIEEEGYWNGYDPNVNPSAAEEFITSAFRFGHSLLPHKIERWSHSHKYIESTDLSRLIRQPFDMYRPGYADTFIMGLTNQMAQAMDEGVTEQVTTMLFKEPRKQFGMDLAAMNIQRGRDHAVPGYTAYREICGLPPVSRWDDLIGIMKNETVYNYKHIYRSPHDIDLWSGGVSEIPSHGSLIGPTFGCIISRQFQGLRYGDRFWYELPDLPSSFTPEQLQEIKKVKLSRMLCDNSDSLKTIQVYAMIYPDPKMNPRVPCKGLVIPRINLEKWRESPHPEDVHHESEHAFPKFKHGYQTLHPPKFDPAFITSSSHNTLPSTHSSDTHENYSNTHSNYYNDSHETTYYPQESPSYPDLRNSVQYHSKNSYKGITIKHSEPFTSFTPQYNYNQNYNESAINYDQTGLYGNQQTKGDMGLIETLEPPPVESTLLFIPNPNHSTNHYPDHLSNHYPEDQSNHYPEDQSNHYPEDQSNHYLDHLPNHYPDHLSNYYPDHLSNYYPDHLPNQYSSDHPGHSNSRTHYRPITRRRPKVSPFPKSPFPGLGGVFSPNPGYLVRQKFSVYKAPAPSRQSWSSIFG